MPSSLTRVLSLTLGFSPRPPASVCGTGTLNIASAFSCQRGFTCFTTCISLPITAPPYSARTSLRTSLTAWTGSTINRLMLSFCVNASLLKVVLGVGGAAVLLRRLLRFHFERTPALLFRFWRVLCRPPRKDPFSRSYGVILPSSLTRVLSLT